MTLWRDVKGYEGFYKVSNSGEILALKRPHCYRKTHLMSQCDDGRGYKIVCLCKNGTHKTERVHRLVAIAFIPNPNGFNEINHIDENKSNNFADNLEWCNRKYNINYGSRTHKTSTRIAMYSSDMNHINTYSSIRDACRENGLKCPGNISNVLKGKAKTAYGYIWKEVI